MVNAWAPTQAWKKAAEHRRDAKQRKAELSEMYRPRPTRAAPQGGWDPANTPIIASNSYNGISRGAGQWFVSPNSTMTTMTALPTQWYDVSTTNATLSTANYTTTTRYPVGYANGQYTYHIQERANVTNDQYWRLLSTRLTEVGRAALDAADRTVILGNAYTSANYHWTHWIKHPGRNYTPRPGLVEDWATHEWIEPEEYADRQIAREETANRMREEEALRNAARDAAEARADELLLSMLTPTERERWAREKVVEVTTPKGRVVQLAKGWAGNAVELHPKTRARVRRFCIHPSSRVVPETDNVAAQMLMLLTDEDEFFRVANASVLR